MSTLAGLDPDRTSGRASVRHLFGAATASEWLTVISGHMHRTRRAIPLVWCHGYGARAANARPGTTYDDLRPLAALGYPVLAGDLGGDLWANDTAIARVDAIITWATNTNNLFVRGDKVIIAGEGEGSLLALNWAWRNPQKVAAIWLRGPIPNLIDFHDQNLDLSDIIEAAYGGQTQYQAGLPTHDPSLNLGLLQGLGRKMRIDYALDDARVPATAVETFAASTGAVINGFPGGHGDVIWSPPVEVADFIDRCTRLPGGATAPPVTYPVDVAAQREHALERSGRAVSQTQTQDYTAKFLAYIRDAGSAVPSDAHRRFLGGDVVSVISAPTGGFLWLCLDAWAGGTNVVNAVDDTFNNVALLPFRNAVITENGSFALGTQAFGNGGTTGEWLRASVEGGIPGGVWWPGGGVTDGGSIRLHVITLNPFSSAPFGIDRTDIITLNAFGLYASHVSTTWGQGANFWAGYSVTDSVAGFHYVLGQVLNLTSAGADASVNALRATRNERKIARVAVGSANNPAAYTFWTGSTWSSNPTDAQPMLDAITGDIAWNMTAIHRVATGHWIGVGRQSFDHFLDVWRATAPQGPWTKISRIYVAEEGQLMDPPPYTNEGWWQLSHHAGIAAHIPAPSGCVIAWCTGLLANTAGTTIPWDNVGIRHWSPRFVVVPTSLGGL